MINYSERITKKFFKFSDMIGVFATVDDTTQFILVPKGTENDLCDEKLCCVSPLGCIIHKEPVLHIAVSGDGYACDYTSGTTQRNSDTAMSLKLVFQNVEELDETIVLTSVFENDKGLSVKNIIEHRKGSGFLSIYNQLQNNGEEILLESLPSFNLSCISPFDRFNDTENIVLHKFISGWSGEGKLYSVSCDKLGLESSWSGLGIREEKWSQTGTMPARNQLPFVAVEDKKNGVCWAAMMEAPASWEIETVLRNGNISIGGGQSDFITGHWRKKIETGEVFTTRKAYVTVINDGLENACDRLVKAYDYFDVIKEQERTLPVLYNEWCSSWGKPRHDELLDVLPFAKEVGCKYFVVDDGWFQNTYGETKKVLGDWYVHEEAFPYGLKAFSKEVQKRDMTFGVWYEFERVSICTDIYKRHPDWVLTYEGKPIIHQGKAFFDFRKKEVVDYLREKVINNLIESEIGYMKVDYNDNIGLGVDGAESYGEGLRAHMEAVIEFFKEIKRAMPNLILEICSSGGMRHEPNFLRLADMVSFSDAHECPSGVSIACNLHRYIPPRKLQIWAVIREEYTVQDVCFTCAKAMLGRFCYSGKLATKSFEVLSVMKNATSYYESITDIIANGKTTVIYDDVKSYLHTKGIVYLIRESLDGKEKLLYAFAIAKPCSKFCIEIGEFTIKSAFNAPVDLKMQEGKVCFTSDNCTQWGCVLRLQKKV